MPPANSNSLTNIPMHPLLIQSTTGFPRLGRFLTAGLIWFAWGALPAEAANWSRVLSEFTETGKVATKESVYAAEDAVRIVREAPGLGEAAGREARYLGAEAGSRTAMRKLLSKALMKEGGDLQAIRFVDDLAEADVDVAVVYLRGGRRLREAVPDVVTRARLTRQGGAPALASLGLSDAVPVDDFLKMDALVASGKIPAEVAGKPTLARLGELMADGSERSAKFYGKYVRGNEGKWLAGGALVFWMANPDAVQDAAGNLTETGFKKLSQLGGEVLASSLRGIAEGSKDAGRKLVGVTLEHYFSGPDAWAAWLGLGFFAYAVGVALPVTRRIFLKPLYFLMRPRHSPNHNSEL